MNRHQFWLFLLARRIGWVWTLVLVAWVAFLLFILGGQLVAYDLGGLL